jgi:oligopeptide/dipeptide ABC transporter ATP-binding protein
MTDLHPIKGVVPDPFDLPAGCCFETRCPRTMDVCKEEAPPLKEISTNHFVACWLYN